MTPIEAKYFGCDCDGLVACILTAADPSLPDYRPYYGHATSRAVWQLRHVLRKARALGLLTDAAIDARIAEREKVQRQRERWSRAS